MALETLTEKQNPDGGWPYVRGGSWTEPTVWAVLALLGEGEIEAARKGVTWLMGIQRPDGGWPARASVAECCWVTALVALLPPEELGKTAHARAVAWLLGITGMESRLDYRVRSWLLGRKIPPEQAHAGWPWVPGTAAWVAPTALAVLALEKEQRRQPSSRVAERIEAGKQFLLSRTCADGGWNHGSVPDLGYEAHAYPEITGLVLAALRGAKGPKMERALTVARGLLEGCRSADASNWLRLGLTAQGALPAGYRASRGIAYRTMPDVSLQALAGAAESGRSPLWC